MTFKELKSKVNEKTQVVQKKFVIFWEKHGEATSIVIGGLIGALVSNYIIEGELQKAHKKGYISGYEKGHDDVYDELWLDAAFNGGSNNTILRNKEGYRLGLHYETLPNKK